jgi:hypothetical protein
MRFEVQGMKNKQTRMPEEAFARIKAHAAIERKPLEDVIEEAITDFFVERKQSTKDNKDSPLPTQYLAPPVKGMKVNAKLPEKMAKTLEDVAEEDDQSGSRVMYTSLVKYGQKKKLW